MGNTVSNVSAGKPKIGGAVFTAPLGTTLPTDATSSLGSAFKCLGYVSDDGVTNSNGPDTETVKAWGGDVVLITESEKTDEWQFTLIEVLNEDVLKVVYEDANVSGALSTGLTVRANNTPHTARVWVFDMKMTNGLPKRIVIPNAVISELGDIEYTDGDPIGYEITLMAMPGDSDFGYDTHKEYIGQTGATGATGAS